jgi:hypothetical protein
MKKLILTLSLFVGMSLVASAQSAASSTNQPKPVVATQQPDQGTVSKATSEAKVEASTEKKCAGQTKACCKSKTETTTASSCKSKSESGAACCKKKADAKKD